MTVSLSLITIVIFSLAFAAALKKTAIQTPNAPKAIGPYSQGILLEMQSGERLISAAGQIGLDPQTGSLVPGGIAKEAKQAMNNVEAIITAVPGASMEDIHECFVLLSNLTDYDAFNDVYKTYFSTDPPARAAYEVSRLPKDARVEIKCSAAL